MRIGPNMVIKAFGYHAVSKEEFVGNADYLRLCVPENIFRGQMEYLKKKHSFLQFRDLALIEDGAMPCPPNPALVYFDDGYKEVLENAYPILKDMGIKATVFITINFVEKKSVPVWANRESNLFLSWEEVNSMKDVFEVGSHGVTHSKLNKLSADELRWELEDSRNSIQEHAGVVPIALSYPHSSFSAEVQRAAIRAGYRYTVGNGRGFNYGPCYRFLKKIPVGPKDTMPRFSRKVEYYPVIHFFERALGVFGIKV